MERAFEDYLLEQEMFKMSDFVKLNDYPTLPTGSIIRPPVLDDAPQLADILAACERDVTGTSTMTVNDFLGDWEGADLENNARVILAPDGTPAAYADIDNRGDVIFTVYGYVLPATRGNGYGSYLVAWSEERVKAISRTVQETARIVTRAYINERDTNSHALLIEKGYGPIRATYTMKIDLESRPDPVALPNGITIRNFVPGTDDAIAFEAYEEAFADMWQRPPGTFEQFLSKTRRSYFDPVGWFLAMDGDTVAGTLFSDNIDGNGWVEIVGVRRPWRGKGLAHAMLRHAFAGLYDRGVTHIGLSVDAQSPTGAPRIYERAGMQLDQSYFLFERELRPGTVAAAGTATS